MKLYTIYPSLTPSLILNTETAVVKNHYSSNADEEGRRGLLHLAELTFRKDWDSDEDEFWDDY